MVGTSQVPKRYSTSPRTWAPPRSTNGNAQPFLAGVLRPDRRFFSSFRFWLDVVDHCLDCSWIEGNLTMSRIRSHSKSAISGARTGANQLRAEGHEVRDADVARLSPLIHEHINM